MRAYKKDEDIVCVDDYEDLEQEELEKEGYEEIDTDICYELDAELEEDDEFPWD